MKNKKLILVIVGVFIAVLLLALYAVLASAAIEKQTWELLSASKIGEPFPVVAHKSGLDVSEDKYFMHSKEVELICTAEDGKLTLTDKTNDKVYEGTYKSKVQFSFTTQAYNCVIDGKECTIFISYRFMDYWNADTFTVTIDGYTLTFVKK